MSRALSRHEVHYQERGTAPSICVNCNNLVVEANRGGYPRCPIIGEYITNINGTCNRFSLFSEALELEVLTRLADNQPQIEKALSLRFPKNQINLLKKLETPDEIYRWLKQNIKYGHDKMREVYNGFEEVIKSGKGDCFRGMIATFPLLYFRGYNPKILLLQAGDNSSSEDHNVVAYEETLDRRTKYGAMSLSSWPTLEYRPATYDTLDALARSYELSFTSPKRGEEHQVNLRGYAVIDPIHVFGEAEFFKMLFSKGKEADSLVKKFYRDYTLGAQCIDLRTGKSYPYPQT